MIQYGHNKKLLYAKSINKNSWWSQNYSWKREWDVFNTKQDHARETITTMSNQPGKQQSNSTGPDGSAQQPVHIASHCHIVTLYCAGESCEKLSSERSRCDRGINLWPLIADGAVFATVWAVRGTRCSRDIDTVLTRLLGCCVSFWSAVFVLILNKRSLYFKLCLSSFFFFLLLFDW